MFGRPQHESGRGSIRGDDFGEVQGNHAKIQVRKEIYFSFFFLKKGVDKQIR
jgi:hypothetical protein